MAGKKLGPSFADQSRAFQSAGGRLQGERPALSRSFDMDADKFRSYETDDVDLGADSFSHERSGLKDQEHHVQDLKKENFDLKLRLYMEQKNNETAKEKLAKYEAQLSQLLDKFDESTQYINKIEVEMKDSRVREKTLLTQQKRLELKCAEQDEVIQNLSLQSKSMKNLSASVVHSTPMRHTSSAVNLHPMSDEGVQTDLESDSYQMSPIDSHRRHSDADRRSGQGSSRRRGAENDYSREDKPSSFSGKHGESYTNATVSNFYRSESMDGRSGMALNNVAYVSPNNAQVVSPNNLPSPVTRKPKKKKGLAKLFNCCAGKSSQYEQDEAYSPAPQSQPHGRY